MRALILNNENGSNKAFCVYTYTQSHDKYENVKMQTENITRRNMRWKFLEHANVESYVFCPRT